MDPIRYDKKALGIESMDEQMSEHWLNMKGETWPSDSARHIAENILAGFLKHIQIVRPKQATFPKVGQ